MAANSILIVATGADEIRTTGWRTGLWFSELTHGRLITVKIGQARVPSVKRWSSGCEWMPSPEPPGRSR